MTGLTDVAQQLAKQVVTVGENVGMVILEGQRPVLAGKQLYECLVIVGNHQVFLFHKLQHRPLGQLVEALLADEPFLTRVLSEEEIEEDAQQGQECQHQHPCHGLGGLAIVHQHAYHGSHHGQAVDEQNEPVNVYHTMMLLPSFLASVLRMFCISLYCSTSIINCCGLSADSEMARFSSRSLFSA